MKQTEKREVGRLRPGSDSKQKKRNLAQKDLNQNIFGGSAGAEKRVSLQPGALIEGARRYKCLKFPKSFSLLNHTDTTNLLLVLKSQRFSVGV